ncbi:unnamed protein product [Cyclocybe aegerita]|uniref:Uncharacterized protein n=1 Tax=Cyclocybe aegerita TaxID=1973307 RepID=A0A8S0W3D1_CYCAE|nr:unnamed protein product [Cyclocybe aegerita]
MKIEVNFANFPAERASPTIVNLSSIVKAPPRAQVGPPFASSCCCRSPQHTASTPSRKISSALVRVAVVLRWNPLTRTSCDDLATLSMTRASLENNNNERLETSSTGSVSPTDSSEPTHHATTADTVISDNSVAGRSTSIYPPIPAYTPSSSYDPPLPPSGPITILDEGLLRYNSAYGHDGIAVAPRPPEAFPSDRLSFRSSEPPETLPAYGDDEPPRYRRRIENVHGEPQTLAFFFFKFGFFFPAFWVFGTLMLIPPFRSPNPFAHHAFESTWPPNNDSFIAWCNERVRTEEEKEEYLHLMRKSELNQYQSTAHATWGYDDRAVLTFEGVGVKVYGTLPPGTGTAAVDFSLDGRSGLRVWKPSQRSQYVFNELWFDSGVLSAGTHTITMANKGEDNDMDFRLDRVVVELVAPSASSTTTPNNPPATTTPQAQGSSSTTAPLPSTSATNGNPNLSPSSGSSVSGSSTSSIPPSVVVTTVGSQTIISTVFQTPATSVLGSSADPTNISAAAESSSNSTPTIVGAVVGVVVFLLLVLGLLFYWRRRKAAARREYSDSAGESGIARPMAQNGVTPFTVPPPTSETHADSLTNSYGKSQTISQRNLLQTAPPPSSGRQPSSPSESQSSAHSQLGHPMNAEMLPEKHSYTLHRQGLISPTFTHDTDPTLVYVRDDRAESERPPSYYPRQ